jgi:mannose-6-phosphate isomerase-like protein (cupin superfamily)
MNERLAAAPVSTTVVMPPGAIEELPWVPLTSAGGAEHRLLWRSGDSYVGILRIEPGHEIAGHVHQHAHHHVWILEGEADMVGQRVGPGSYVHVPGGVEHRIAAAGPRETRILYLYLRQHDTWNPEGLV